MFTLKKGELDVMEVFWREPDPLSHAGLCEQLDGIVGRNTIYLHLNNLLRKGAIESGPSVRRGRTYGRTFSAALTKAEYYAMQVADASETDDATLCNVFSYFLGSKHVTKKTLDELEKRLEQKRRDLDP